MTSEERLRAVLAGQVPDRVPVCDAYWTTTIERWRSEGLPDGPPEELFDLDWVRLAGDYSLELVPRVVEETERFRLLVDANGVTQRHLRTADGWVPHYEAYPIACRTEFEALRERFEYRPSRIPADLAQRYRRARERRRFVFYSGHACFHGTWAKVGQVPLMTWMLDQPDLVRDLFAAHTRLMCDLYDGMKAAGCRFDGAFIMDDLGATRSPLISPWMYDELVLPYHRRLCEHFAADGLATILHSDGNVAPLIPSFLKAGFRGLHPLECKAGLHVAELKARYGSELVLFGNIDVRALAAGPDEAVREVREKLAAGMPGGGYLFHSDHSVPSDVPLATYQRVLDTVRRHGSY